MIITEVINNFKFTRSDNNKYILQVETGNKYDAAWDVLDSAHTYIETDIEIEIEVL